MVDDGPQWSTGEVKADCASRSTSEAWKRAFMVKSLVTEDITIFKLCLFFVFDEPETIVGVPRYLSLKKQDKCLISGRPMIAGNSVIDADQNCCIGWLVR